MDFRVALASRDINRLNTPKNRVDLLLKTLLLLKNKGYDLKVRVSI